MSREYRHIKQYEKEIMHLREEGLTYREIGEQLGIEQSKIRCVWTQCTDSGIIGSRKRLC